MFEVAQPRIEKLVLNIISYNICLWCTYHINVDPISMGDPQEARATFFSISLERHVSLLYSSSLFEFKFADL